MYNEDIKKRYIIEKERITSTPEGYLKRLFEKTETFEKRLGKDISSFTVYDIIDVYKTFNLTSINFLTVLHSHLTLYTDWCLKQNIVPDCQNHFSELNSETLYKCINIVAFKKTIITKEILYSWLEKIINPSDAFIMIALFEGIKGKDFCEIVNLNMSDFSSNQVKLCTGRELTVSDKLVNIALEASTTKIYYSTNGSGKQMPFLDEKDKIVKNYPNCQNDANAFYQGRRIYSKITRAFSFLEVDEWMKPNAIFDSGQIDYINTRAKELGMSGKDFIYSEYIKEVDYRYGSNLSRTKIPYIRKFEEYLI